MARTPTKSKQWFNLPLFASDLQDAKKGQALRYLATKLDGDYHSLRKQFSGTHITSVPMFLHLCAWMGTDPAKYSLELNPPVKRKPK